MHEKGSSTVRAEEILANANEKNIVAQWDDAHRHSPAPRHRRRLLLNAIANLGFRDVLDAGCAQPYLLAEIVRRYNVQGYGCDISDQVMSANQASMPHCQFRAIDLTREVWPDGRTFDLVISSEVLEHIPDWRTALANLVRMSHRHLLITVPGGKRRTMDKLVGHHQHFHGPELLAALEDQGCRIVRVRRWGYPMHSLYKQLISLLSPEKLYNSFGGSHYSPAQRLISELLYGVFFVNDLFDAGDQLIVQARVSAMQESTAR
jgi:SAM-dependent methyltransferase